MIYLTRKVEPNFVTIVLQIQLFKIHKIQNSISPCKVEGVRDSVHKIIVFNCRGNGECVEIYLFCCGKLVSTPPPPLDLTALCSTAALQQELLMLHCVLTWLQIGQWREYLWLKLEVNTTKVWMDNGHKENKNFN